VSVKLVELMGSCATAAALVNWASAARSTT
jgi:hypothetical protein